MQMCVELLADTSAYTCSNTPTAATPTTAAVTTTTVAAVAGQHFKRIYIMRIFMLALKCNQNALRAISITICGG